MPGALLLGYDSIRYQSLFFPSKKGIVACPSLSEIYKSEKAYPAVNQYFANGYFHLPPAPVSCLLFFI